ncbi:MAG TPA: hypothetical protein VF292_10045 [Rhodanobacteraceae bacterium]
MRADIRTDVLAEYNNTVAPALARIGIALVNYVATAGGQTRGSSLSTRSGDDPSFDSKRGYNAFE